MFRWSVALMFNGPHEKERDWEGHVEAPTVEAAILKAILASEKAADELIHMIHIGPPKET